MADALRIQGLCKRYADHVAVDALDLTIPVGQIYGILGPNGAGKSTTLRSALNIIARDAGSVAILGVDPRSDRSVLRRVGYLPEERGLYKKMTVLEVVVFFAQLKGISAAKARAAADRWLERMSLGDWRRAKVESLSKGMQQKVQFITSVIHEPELLILDEPSAGLDPVNQEVMRDTILSARRAGQTVIFSTHNMDQAEDLCESLCIIARGRKVLDGELHEIRRRHRGSRYRVQFEEGETVLPEALSAQSRLFMLVEPARKGLEFSLADGTDSRDALSALNAMPARVAKFERVEPSLHEIFIQHAGALAQPRKQEVAHV